VTEANQEFIQELLRRLHQRLDRSDHAIRELRTDNSSIRGQLLAAQGDLNSMRAVIAPLEDRIDQVEKRLELRYFQEMGQTPFDPGS
jgi:septal ring factor EnvC (AmiA/AmiB activator)